MKTRRIQWLAAGTALLLALTFSACDKYGDDLRSIGRRVEILEDSLLQINDDIALLRDLFITIQGNGYITQIEPQPDGSYVMKFNDGRVIKLRDGLVGADGQNGRDGSSDMLLNVAQGEDGIWYWIVNGEWLLTPDGNKMPVAGIDGKDGKDGQNGLDGQDGKDDVNFSLPIPQVRINPLTRTWEISTDGGATWTDTGVNADGKDGKNGLDGINGADGKDGMPDLVASVKISSDGTQVTFTLTDGRTFVIPVQNNVNY